MSEGAAAARVLMRGLTVLCRFVAGRTLNTPGSRPSRSDWKVGKAEEIVVG